MALKLVVTTNADGDTFELILKEEVHRVGRRHGNDLRIRESYVSAYHAELRRDEGGGYRLVDLDSVNGTFLNGRQIEGGAGGEEGEGIRTGDLIKFGILQVAVEEEEDASNGGPTIFPLSQRVAFSTQREDITAPVHALRSATGPLNAATAETSAVAAVAAVLAEPPAEDRERPSAGERALIGDFTEATARIAELESALSGERERVRHVRDEAAALGQSLEKAENNNRALEARLEVATRHRGELQSEFEHERSEASLLREQLEADQVKAAELRAEIEALGKSIDKKESELLENDVEHARLTNEELLQLKRELGEAVSARKEAEERAAAQHRERLSLSGSFERLKEQWDAAQLALSDSGSREEALVQDIGLLARRLEKAETSSRELAARVKEDAAAALANRELISTLEAQLRENESKAARREQELVIRLDRELRHLKAESREREERATALAAELAEAGRREDGAAEVIKDLRESLLRRDAEIAKERELLRDSEKLRSELATELPDASALALERGAQVEALQIEAAAAAKRFLESERLLLDRHREKVDALLIELQCERDSAKSLQTRLANTRAGLSEALRCAREKAECDLEHLIAESNAKLSKMDETLSESIRRGEAAEEARLTLEDKLNEREERIERLEDHVEDLGIRLEEEAEARSRLDQKLLLTRAGLSSALGAGRRRYEGATAELQVLAAERDDLNRLLASLRESFDAISAESAGERERHATEIAEWEERYDRLREEKFTLDSENAYLQQLRLQIDEARREKDALEQEHAHLSGEFLEEKKRHGKALFQKQTLLSEQETLKVDLKQGRDELDATQRRCSQLQTREESLVETVRSTERRIESLKNLESQMESATRRKRKEQVVSRSDTFLPPTVDPDSAPASNGFSREEFYRKLIARIDLIDDLAKRYESRWRFPRVGDQLAMLKSSFLDLLSDHDVTPFQPDPGTALSLEERKRIKFVPPHEAPGVRLPSKRGDGGNGIGGSHRSLVVQTLRPGYIDHSEGRSVVIRKAEVVVA